MKYTDLRGFLAQLESLGELKRVGAPVSPRLEMTEFCDRVLRAGGPALLFEKPEGFDMPVLGNLFGTVRRVALAMGATRTPRRSQRCATSATCSPFCASRTRPRGCATWDRLPEFRQLAAKVLDMAPKVRSAPCQEVVWEGADVDLGRLPIQTCWPGDAGPLITWGLTVTRGPAKKRQNLGIYRQQVIAPNKVIMRWLAHRGGALDFRDHALAHPGEPFPVAVALGADPATILGAVTPVPDIAVRVPVRRTVARRAHRAGEMPRQRPAGAGQRRDRARRRDPSRAKPRSKGPYGDHTGYYNEQEWFPVFTIERITMRRDPIYHSTYTGKPPDEPAMLGVALNEVFVPLLQKQFPEIIDFYLPPEGCSYRMAVVSMKKQYPGHAKRVMFGVWSFLRQFMYTKFIVVVDDDVNVRDWKEVIWAMTTRVDPARDTLIVENTPIDYLDFASPVSGLGSKMGIDATNKWPGETTREWGRPIVMDAERAQPRR